MKLFFLLVCLFPILSLISEPVFDSAPCSSENQLKSENMDAGNIAINFVNNLSEKIYIYWINFEGKSVLYKELNSHSSFEQFTYPGNIWIAKNKKNECISIYILKENGGKIVIGNGKNGYQTANTERSSKVQKINSALREEMNLDPFYKKYINESGLFILSSDKVPDQALLSANEILKAMLKNAQHILKKLQESKIKVAIMAVSEKTLDIPEHSDLQEAFPQTDWNKRSRGLGATLARPVTSAAEENLLCYETDPYRGESILVHEFAHTILLGLELADIKTYNEVKAAFESARKKGLWKNTYAGTNVEEYWAEGVQSWFDVNLESIPSNGIHNEINTRSELKKYDPTLAKLISKVFGEEFVNLKCK